MNANLSPDDLSGMFVCYLDLSPDLDGEIETRFLGERHPDRSGPCEDDAEETAPYVGAILTETKIGRKKKRPAVNPYDRFDDVRASDILEKKRKEEARMMGVIEDEYEQSGSFLFRKL